MTAGNISEAEIQMQIRSYLAAVGIDSIHIPNGSHLAGDKIARVKQANALKRAGIMPGISDLILLDRRFVSRVGFLEVKSEKGRLSLAQEGFADLCEKVWSLPFAVVRSVADTQVALAAWGWR